MAITAVTITKSEIISDSQEEMRTRGRSHIPDADGGGLMQHPNLRRDPTKRFATVISDIYDTLNRLWYDNVIDYESEHNVVSVAIRAAKFAREWSKGNKSAAFLRMNRTKDTWIHSCSFSCRCFLSYLCLFAAPATAVRGYWTAAENILRWQRTITRL